MSSWTYFQIEIIPLLTLLCLFLVFFSHSQISPSNRRFKIFIALVMGMIGVDVLNWHMLLSPKEFPAVILWIGNILYFLLTELIAYVWFIYVFLLIYENAPFPGKKLWMRVSKAILVLSCVFILLSPWTHMVFYIEPSDLSYHRGRFHLLHAGCAFGFLIVTSVFAYYYSKKVVLQELKKEYRFLCFIVLLPLCGGLLQMLNYDFVFLLPFSVAAIFLIFCNIQEQQISVDALTTLNNRGNLERYLQKKMQSNETEWYLIMIDADGFKVINDKYGHMEGDRALQIIAQSLKQVFGGTTAFLSRYGGDEFVVIEEAASNREIDQLLAACKEAIKEESLLWSIPYEIKISAGYAKYTNSTETPISELIGLADERMYEQKKSNKRNS